jgi:hypothetical protein
MISKRYLTVGIVAVAIGMALVPSANADRRVAGTGAVSCSSSLPPVQIGSAISSTDLAAVTFISHRAGVAVTAAEVPCQIGPGGGGSRAFPLRLAQTEDGGHSWNVEGSASPPNIPHRPFPQVDLAFETVAKGWLSAGGKLEATDDGGRQWRTVNLDSQRVLAVQRVGQVVFTLTTTHLWRLASSSSRWAEGAALPAAMARSLVGATVITAFGPATGDVVVVTSELGDLGPQGVESSDAGRRWQRVADPCAARNWVAVMAMAQTPDGQIFMLCGGGAAAGSGTRGLYVSSTRGSSWELRVADTNLALPNRSGLPVQDFGDVLVSPTNARLFLAVGNGFATSNDGGKQWTGERIAGTSGGLGFNLQGAGGLSSFVELSPELLWMLTPGVGLFRSVDGHTWRYA